MSDDVASTRLCYVLGVKLVIQIPAWNEAEHLGATLDALPTTVPGFDVVEVPGGG
jgi:hypothetical protein